MTSPFVSDSTRPVAETAAFPEFASLEAFLEAKWADEDFDVQPWELDALSLGARTSISRLVSALKAEGFAVLPRGGGAAPVRGFKANPHNRWSASGNCGGSGHEQIAGFAGRDG